MRTILTLGLIGLCGVCFGQDTDREDQRVGLLKRAVIRAGPNNPGKKVVEPDVFDNAIGNGSTIAEWQSWWETMLNAQVQSDATKYKLVAEERRKLRVAGKGDLKRLIDRLELAHQEFDAIQEDPDKRAEFFGRAVGSLRKDVQRGPFDADSYYEKVLRRMKASRAIRFSLPPDRI
jgi:hypothetical protein